MNPQRGHAKQSKAHQQRCGVAAPASRAKGTALPTRFSDRPAWHWSDSVTLQAVEVKMQEIEERFRVPIQAAKAERTAV